MAKTPLKIVKQHDSPASDSIHLGKRLRTLREACSLSQESAAVRAGMTRNTLARHEASAFPDLKLSTILALMELYDVASLDGFVGRSPAERLLQSWVGQGRPGLRGEFVG